MDFYNEFQRQNFRRVKPLSITDFRFISQIGQGGYGVVYLMATKSGEILAVKKMDKKMLFLQEEIIHIKTERDLMEKSRSEWLVKLHHAFQDEDCIYLAMEYVPGGDFRNFLNRNRILTESTTRFYCAQMFIAIDQVHKMGYIHRDVKPENFLITTKGFLKLTDFGLSHGMHVPSSIPNICIDKTKLGSIPKNSRDLNQRLDIYKINDGVDNRAFSIVGSPEIIQDSGAGYDYAVDYWSVGCMIFECLTGFPPFTEEDMDQVWKNVRNWQKTLKRPIYNDDEFRLNMGDAAWSLITQLITYRNIRIDSIAKLQAHPFFHGFDFQDILESKPPFIPKLGFPTDTRHFDDFSNEKDMELYVQVLERHKKLQSLHQETIQNDLRCDFINFDYNHTH